ncbi:LacI family DNA-binding transcriptional regulator [Corynebacterium glutamicum]|uniref:LacI family DNA-binding transcriptional regulator n=1 Tax=Corynebacterium glutamicum TaxID=1718 RepID=UPI000589B6DC|nr:LacI family DNA-binding transcriptional regulator [Corynebacterium glutamicum]KIH72727.1 LacI family transcriptional regulator [Corynebacterium glutamicum]
MIMGRKQQYGTLASIAAKLGVSRTTVSNAYNRPEQLSAELRQRILDTAEDMGYLGPDPVARSLRTRRAGAIGVLLTEDLTYAFEDMASVDFLAGVAQAAGDTQLTLIPASPASSVDHVSAQQLVNNAAIDGVVIYSVAKGDPHIDAIRARGLPAVIADQPAGEEGMPFIAPNNRKAIAPAAQALIDAGHRKIGILSIRLDRANNDGEVTRERLENAQYQVQRDRVRGAMEVFIEAGIDPDTVPIMECWINNRQHNFEVAKELLETHPNLTAVLCTVDALAFGVLEYLKSVGKSASADLSLTGFDGTHMALARDLTTVIQPNKLKGFKAGETLLKMIDKEYVEPEVELETSFHPGSTVAPI